MKRVLAICFLIFILNTTLVNASGGTKTPNDERPPLEEFYFEIGYKTVEDALKECENHFHRDLRLPTSLPPVEFTRETL